MSSSFVLKIVFCPILKDGKVGHAILARLRARRNCARQCIKLIMNNKMYFDHLIVSIAIKSIEIRVYEVSVKINTIKIGDGLIFGYVPRRKTEIPAYFTIPLSQIIL